MKDELSLFGHVSARTLDCGGEGVFSEYTVDTGRSYLHSDTIAAVQEALKGSEWIIKAAPAAPGELPRLLIIAEVPVEAGQ